MITLKYMSQQLWTLITHHEYNYLEEDIKTIPVYEKNKNVDITLKSSHPAPATLRAMAWEGDYSPLFYKRA